jgi:hypothetical protein
MRNSFSFESLFTLKRNIVTFDRWDQAKEEQRLFDSWELGCRETLSLLTPCVRLRRNIVSFDRGQARLVRKIISFDSWGQVHEKQCLLCQLSPAHENQHLFGQLGARFKRNILF